MKKIVFVFLLSLGIPVLALCPIDTENSVCSLTDAENKIVKPFSTNDGGIRNFQSTENNLNPLNQENSGTQMREPNSGRNYDSQCQLGNCLQEERNTSIIDKRNK